MGMGHLVPPEERSFPAGCSLGAAFGARRARPGGQLVYSAHVAPGLAVDSCRTGGGPALMRGRIDPPFLDGVRLNTCVLGCKTVEEGEDGGKGWGSGCGTVRPPTEEGRQASYPLRGGRREAASSALRRVCANYFERTRGQATAHADGRAVNVQCSAFVSDAA